jgi:hypothetical protein
MDGMCKVVDVGGGDADDGDAAVLRQVDGVLFRQLLHLLRRHSREAEHSDLVGDVRPVPGRTLALQTLTERVPHRNDAVSHSLHFR